MRVFQSGRDEVPLDHELEVRVGWFVRLRWAAGAAVLLGSTGAWLAGLERATVAPLVVAGTAVLGYNALLAWLYRRLAGGGEVRSVWWRVFAHLQVALDWMALTILSGLSGGLESPFLLFFTLYVILVAILVRPWECFLQTTLALLLTAGLAYGRELGLSTYVSNSPLAVVRVYGNAGQVTAYLLVFASLLYLYTFVASAIANRLRRREKQLLDSQQQGQRMHAEMALLYELAKSITSTLDLDLVLQRVAEQAARTLQAKACSIRLLGESGELQICAAYGLSEAYLRKGRVDLARSPIDREALLGHAVLVQDLTRENLFQYPEEAVREGIRSVLCVPLLAQNRAIGVVRVYSEVPGHFDREDVQFLQNFANLASIAINNARAWRILQDMDRERSRFVRILAHELRAPLSAILINLGVILDGYVGDVPEKVAHLLRRARQRSNLLLDLTNDLLALASGKEAAAEPAYERLSLAEIAQQTINDLQSQAQAKALQIEFSRGEGNLEVLGDREQLERLMDNLVSNAVKYTGEGGRVTVRLSGNEGSVELVVEDTGIGIPRAVQDRLFEEFFRAENARRFTEQGTGLGLSIVKRIVEDHRAKIAVESEEGQGTRITVVFPRNGQQWASPDPSTARASS